MGREFEVELREVVDDVGGSYVIDLAQRKKGTRMWLLLKSSDVYDNLGDAMDAFAKLQYEWFEELKVDARVDYWRVRMDVTL